MRQLSHNCANYKNCNRFIIKLQLSQTNHSSMLKFRLTCWRVTKSYVLMLQTYLYGSKVFQRLALKRRSSFRFEIAEVLMVSPRYRLMDSFGSHPSDTPGYNPFELQSSTPSPPDTPLRSIRREIEHLLKVSRKDDAALGLFKTLTFSDMQPRICPNYLVLIGIYDFRNENYFAVSQNVLYLYGDFNL